MRDIIDDQLVFNVFMLNELPIEIVNFAQDQLSCFLLTFSESE